MLFLQIILILVILELLTYLNILFMIYCNSDLFESLYFTRKFKYFLFRKININKNNS